LVLIEGADGGSAKGPDDAAADIVSSKGNCDKEDGADGISAVFLGADGVGAERVGGDDIGA
jgi:hypothetical protein